MTRGRAAFLLAAVFLSGAAVMVVEMTAVRTLQPFFGSTNYVWTNVIAVVLGALAAGYAIGGRLADRRPSGTLLYGLLAAGGLCVVASVWLVTPLSEALLPTSLNLEGVTSLLVKGSLVASLVLFAPAAVLMGTISPLAIKLLSEAGVGKAAGRVFSISTVGSILGTYLPTLWLVPAFGSRKSLLIASAMLLLPAVVGLLVHAGRRGGVAAALAVIVAAPLAATAKTEPNRSVPVLPQDGIAKVLEETESPYQYLTVRDDRFPESGTTYRLLTINEGVYTYHSFKVLGRVLTQSRYYDDYSLLPALCDLEPGEELRGAIVGLACGITSSQWKHFWGGLYRLEVDGAEIDPRVLELGRRWFDLPADGSDWLRAHVMDGRQMLAAMPRDAGLHMVVVDAFANELYIPFHLGTLEFFELCRSRLAEGGVLAMNVYAYRPDSPNLAALENTMAKVFGHAVRVRQYIDGNFVLLARRGTEPPDVTRLIPARIRGRFGAREDVAEWEDFLRNADYVARHATIVRHDPGKRVLTDEHAPLEHLTEQFLDRAEEELLEE